MWIIAGAIAFIAAILNIILIFSGRRKYCGVLVLVSLSSGLITMLSQYRLINSWVKAGDMSALTDVVPTMNIALTAIVLIGIILNAVAVFVNYRKSA